MSSFNPFRVKSDGRPTTASLPQTTDPDLFTKPILPIPKAALSLETESENSTSSDDQTDPFNPNLSGSENLDKMTSSKSSDLLDDNPRHALAALPAPSAPSTGSSSTVPIEPSIARPPSIRENVEPSKPRQLSSGSTRSTKDKKPPPPPRSHHGKRISVAGNIDLPSRPSSSRLSFHASSPEILTSRTQSTPYTSSQTDYFSAESPAADSTDPSLSRSQSQHKRPPTPPLSRRFSQMHRSKSTHSKSSVTRLPSAQDSESNYGSQPPSPGLSTRSVGSTYSQKNKHLSMPPLTLGDTVTSSPASYVDPISPPVTTRPVNTRRTSSHGSILNGSSGGPPPPPPPRRARDSIIRSSDGDSVSQKGVDAGAEILSPLPKASNANDILADLSRLQKEVDDLRGHYESRKLSQ